MNDDLVVIAEGYGLPETQAALCLLRAHGVEPVATPLHMATLFWHHMVAFGGVSIRVPHRQAALAHELIADAAAPSAAGRLPVAIRLVLAALAFFLFTVPPPATGFFPRAAIARRARD